MWQMWLHYPATIWWPDRVFMYICRYAPSALKKETKRRGKKDKKERKEVEKGEELARLTVRKNKFVFGACLRQASVKKCQQASRSKCLCMCWSLDDSECCGCGCGCFVCVCIKRLCQPLCYYVVTTLCHTFVCHKPTSQEKISAKGKTTYKHTHTLRYQKINV